MDRHLHRGRFSDTFVEVEPERRQNQFQALSKVRRETGVERRTVYHEGLERLTLLLNGRGLDPDLLAIHGNSLPPISLLWGFVFICGKSHPSVQHERITTSTGTAEGSERTIYGDIGFRAGSQQQRGHHDRQIGLELGAHSLAHLGPCRNQVVAQHSITRVYRAIYNTLLASAPESSDNRGEYYVLCIRIKCSTNALASGLNISLPTAMAASAKDSDESVCGDNGDRRPDLLSQHTP